MSHILKALKYNSEKWLRNELCLIRIFILFDSKTVHFSEVVNVHPVKNNLTDRMERQHPKGVILKPNKNMIATNADSMLFRASSMGAIMTGIKKGWDVDHSLTCKRKLVEMFRQETWQRRFDKSNKYVEKGLAVEEDAITLYCRVKKEMFSKNAIRLNNSYFTGELDLYKGESIQKAQRVIDIKSSWDWTTFPSLCDEVDDNYEYQGLTYMDLTGAGLHTVAYCLVNTPANLIMDEKKKLAWKMNIIDIETEEYIAACIEIEKNCIYDMGLFVKENPHFEFHCINWEYDIPMIERVYEFDVLRNDKKIDAMKARVDECKWWMNKNLFLTC